MSFLVLKSTVELLSTYVILVDCQEKLETEAKSLVGLSILNNHVPSILIIPLREKQDFSTEEQTINIIKFVNVI